MKKACSFAAATVAAVVVVLCLAAELGMAERQMRFGANGQFKILQISDVHIAWELVPCFHLRFDELFYCHRGNTTEFIHRLIQAERPDLIAFTGDMVFMIPPYPNKEDPLPFMDAAFAAAIAENIPWVAILGNHDQEGNKNREQLIRYIAGQPSTLTRVNPSGVEIDGWGNYNIEIRGVHGSSFQDKSVLNLYFLDSLDCTKGYPLKCDEYDWIKHSQQQWFKSTSQRLQREYTSAPNPQSEPAPGLAYFHIPIPEYKEVDNSTLVGDWQEAVQSPTHNSGFFNTMVEAGDVKATFVGHDHVNDYCGKKGDIQLCYAGGSGYQTYGKVGWPRRARVILATLESGNGAVKEIKTWKRLDDAQLSTKDEQVLWTKTKAAVAAAEETLIAQVVG